MKYTKVRTSHLPTAKLIAGSVCHDYLQDSLGLEVTDATEFVEVAKGLKAIALDEGRDPRLTSDTDTIREWLRGLPTACTVPFATYEIYNWLYANTKLTPDASDSKHIAAENNYWNIIAQIINTYASK